MDEKSHKNTPLIGTDIGGTMPSRDSYQYRFGLAELPIESRRTFGVAMIGYAFMGKAHSNAWRNVASFFDVPAFEQKVLVGRDAVAVTEAAAKYGWAESATD